MRTTIPISNRFVTTLLSVLILLVAFAGYASAQEPGNSDVNDVPTLEQHEAIQQALLEAITHRPAWLIPGDGAFAIQSVRVAGDFSFLNAVRYIEPISATTVEPSDNEAIDGHADESGAEIVIPDILLAVAEKQENGQWVVYLEGTPEYADLLIKMPDILVDAEAKYTLLSSQSIQDGSGVSVAAIESKQYSLPGLPWKAGETWVYSQDMHGTGNNGFDFATSNGKEGSVYAADTGVIESATSTCMTLRRSDGLRHGYQHLSTVDIAKWNKKIGQTVTKGTYLGKTTTTSGCGGNSTGHHVHFFLHDNETKTTPKSFLPFGSKLNGFKITDERDYSETLAGGNHPKSGYDYVLRKGSQVICAGTTIQNGRNICTGKTIYHDPNYSEAPQLCKYAIHVRASWNHHDQNMYATYYEPGQGWNDWVLKGRYYHNATTAISMKERPAGGEYHYQVAVWNKDKRRWDYQYIIANTKNGCDRVSFSYWYWDYATQQWKSGSVIPASIGEDGQSPLSNSILDMTGMESGIRQLWLPLVQH